MLARSACCSTSPAAARPAGRPRVVDGGGKTTSRLESRSTVVMAGGTAGHVVPALAVADALRAERRRGLVPRHARPRRGRRLVPAAGYEIDFCHVRGLDRGNPCARRRGGPRRQGGPGRQPRLRARGADAVMGGGGYVAALAGLAAFGLRIPLVLTEADSHLGLANRMLARRARRVCLAFPIAAARASATW